MRAWFGGLVLLVWVGATDASAQGLPASVEEPYAAYLAAVEREDHEAASAAAIRAWREGQAANLSVDDRASLAINALTATDSAGRWHELARIGVDIGQELEVAGLEREAMYSYTRARAASSVTFDAVLGRRAFAAGMDLAYRSPDVRSNGLRAFFDYMAERDTLAHEQAPTPRDILAVLADSASTPDAVLNAAIHAIDDTDARSAADRFSIIDQALNRLIVSDGAMTERLDILFEHAATTLAELDVDGDGVARFSPGNRTAWCAYMRRRPVFRDQVLESLFPTRALERGIREGVVRVRFSAPAAGGEISIPEAEGLSREQGFFRRQLDRALRGEEVRPQCDTTAADVSFRLTEAFAVVEGERVRGGVEFAAMVQRHVVAE